jgi:hypothetical protein
MPRRRPWTTREAGWGAMSQATAFQAVNIGNKKSDNRRNNTEFHTTVVTAFSRQTIQKQTLEDYQFLLNFKTN